MHKNFHSGVGAGILFALCAVASTAQAQAPQATGPARPASPAAQPAPATAQAAAPAAAQPATAPAACTAAIRGDAVPVSATPVAVDAAITQVIGDSIRAEFPAESKLVVSRAAADPAAPQVVKLTLDTSAAAPGEWTMLLKGTAGDCSGKVRITAAK